MPVEIEEFNSSLTRVEWLTTPTACCSEGILREIFQLGRFHQQIPSFEISLTYKYSAKKERRDGTAYFSLNTNVILTPKVDSSSSSENESYTSDSNQPLAVWISINGGEKRRMSELEKEEWELKNYVSDNIAVEGTEWKEICVRLWIEFETLRPSERNTLKCLTKLFFEQKNCDVQFCFKGYQRLGGHTAILATRSSAFAALFSQMEKSEEDLVAIKDMEMHIFEELLHFCYSGRTLAPLTEENAKSLYLAADKFEIYDLKEECVDFLLACIRKDNVINLMVWAHLNMADQIRAATFVFTARNEKELAKLDDWKILKNFPTLYLMASQQIPEV